MMTKALTVQKQGAPGVSIVPASATGTRRSRLQEFERWLQETHRTWANPDLAAYQQYLVTRDEVRTVTTRTGKTTKRHYGPVTPQSVVSYVATIRGRYAELLSENGTRDALYDLAGELLQQMGQQDTPANRKAYVDELERRLANGTKPNGHDVKATRHQDRTDEQTGIRLTRDQADALLASPGLVPVDRLRDTCILALFLCTGIREAELCNLQVSDLRQTKNGELCLRVSHGKGDKARVVFYGGNAWVLAYVDKWLAAAGITSGHVFRGFYKPASDGSRKLRPDKLTTRAVQQIVGSYPAMIDGKMTTIHPHDLRRTYARTWYEQGGDLVGLQQNLGHADLKTTLGYIGLLDASKRKPNAMFTPPHWPRLERLEVQGRIEDNSHS
jgi:site-specific recombinase XerD